MSRVRIARHEIELLSTDVARFIVEASTLAYNLVFKGTSRCRSNVSAARRVARNVAQVAGDICRQLSDCDRAALLDYLRTAQGPEVWAPAKQQVEGLVTAKREIADAFLYDSLRPAQGQEEIKQIIKTGIQFLKNCPSDETMEWVEVAYRLHIHFLKALRTIAV